MAFLTLTTDFGQANFYLASFKGLLYSNYDALKIVDISNDIKAYDVLNASFYLKSCWKSFPKGTLHLFRVGETQVRNSRYVVLERDGHFFLLPDVGVVTLLFEFPPRELILVRNEQKDVSTGEFLAKLVKHILTHQSIEELGHYTSNYNERYPKKPIASPSHIRGVVAHVDHYGNLITNISRQLFERQAKGRDFQIELRVTIFRKIRNSFQEVQSGEQICKFNSEGLLQLSIRNGSAAGLFGISKDQYIQIDFL